MTSASAKLKSCYDWWSVSQYVLVSSSLWNLWPDIIQSHIMTDNESASLSWYQAPIWDQRPILVSGAHLEPATNFSISFSQSQSYIKSWCRAQSGTFDQRYFSFFFFKVSVLSYGSALFDERSVCHLSVYSQSTVVSYYVEPDTI
jgi:hypothetical protein